MFLEDAGGTTKHTKCTRVGKTGRAALQFISKRSFFQAVAGNIKNYLVLKWMKT